MNELAIITPTSDRPVAFALCERWMSRAFAHYGQPVHWYVIDDGVRPVACTMGQTYIRRTSASSSTRSFLGNLLSALLCVKEEKIIFVEDDDWYAEDYVTVVSSWLDEADIVGEARAKYYSLVGRQYKIWGNDQHASLCQTGIRRALLPSFVEIVRASRVPFVDIPLWKHSHSKHKRWLGLESRHCVGMKGLPGKTGMTEGHLVPHWEGKDGRGRVLSEWIGDCDAAVYLKLFGAVDCKSIEGGTRS